MNNILLVTFLAGSVLSEATFPSMNECRSARAEILLQKHKGLNAICVYNKPDVPLEEEGILNPNKLFRDFLDTIEKMKENKCKTNDGKSV